MRVRRSIWLVIIFLAGAFLLVGSGFDLEYVIPKRAARLTAMCIGAICIAFSSIVFQTITNNRILTPAVMGYEAAYLLLQSSLVLAMGVSSVIVVSKSANYVLSVLFVLAYSWAIRRWLLRSESREIHTLLLLGLVLTMVMSTFTQFVQLRTSPGEFSVLEGFAQVAFDRAEPDQLLYSAAIVVPACFIIWKTLPILDVLALGRHQSLSLGVDYRRYAGLYLALIAVFAAVSTSLIGPTAFIGVFVANITYALARTSRHEVTLPLGSAVAIGIFLAAQLLVEQLFDHRTTVGILVNLVCGTYFIVLILRDGKRDVA